MITAHQKRMQDILSNLKEPPVRHEKLTAYVYDIETLKNFHCFVFTDAGESDDTYVFKLWHSCWELDKLVAFLKSNVCFIGYNVLGFDGQVTQFILDTYPRWKRQMTPIGTIISEIYSFTQRTIDLTNNGEFPPYPEWKLTHQYLDLYTMWHFSNKAKATSLKWLQFSMNWPDLREMHIEHWSNVKEEDIYDIVYYCLNDVLSTKEFYRFTKGLTKHPLYEGVDKVQLRKDIMKDEGLDKRIMNWDDVKIGDKLNEQKYLKLSGLKKRNELYELKAKYKRTGTFTFGECIPKYIQFKTPEFQEFYENIKDVTVMLQKETEKDKQEFKFKYKDTVYTIARGGLHSEDAVRIIEPPEGWILRDADVGSQYPNALRKGGRYPLHLGPIWLQLVTANIQKRLDSKAAFKATGDKKHQSINEAYKLALNGGMFGKTGEKTSWQEDLFVHFGCTIGNQFEILMLIEMMEMADIHCVSANTDGIVCLFPKELDDKYYEICHEWEKIVGNDNLGQLEYQDYDKFFQLNINGYMAIKTDDPKKPKPIEDRVKKKGAIFTTDNELHKNKSFRIVGLALEAYFIKGIDPAKFVRTHVHSSPEAIYDYCKAVRGNRGWHFEFRDVLATQTTMFEDISSPKISYSKSVGQQLQKTIRYYISNNGNKIMKCHRDGRAMELEAGPGVATLFNVWEPKDDYDINYNFYLELIAEVIQQFYPTYHL